MEKFGYPKQCNPNDDWCLQLNLYYPNPAKFHKDKEQMWHVGTLSHDSLEDYD